VEQEQATERHSRELHDSPPLEGAVQNNEREDPDDQHYDNRWDRDGDSGAFIRHEPRYPSMQQGDGSQRHRTPRSRGGHAHARWARSAGWNGVHGDLQPRRVGRCPRVSPVRRCHFHDVIAAEEDVRVPFIEPARRTGAFNDTIDDDGWSSLDAVCWPSPPNRVADRVDVLPRLPVLELHALRRDRPTRRARERRADDRVERSHGQARSLPSRSLSNRDRILQSRLRGDGEQRDAERKTDHDDDQYEGQLVPSVAGCRTHAESVGDELEDGVDLVGTRLPVRGGGSDLERRHDGDRRLKDGNPDPGVR